MKSNTYNKLKVWLFLPLLIWQLPQNIIGLFVLLFFAIQGKIKRTKTDDIVWYRITNFKSMGVSLGYFIFLTDLKDRVSVHHEYGHQIQSLMYGWLYLFIVGLPSGLSNVKWASKILYGREVHTYEEYYKGFAWERQADKLGGIKQSGSGGTFTREVVNDEN